MDPRILQNNVKELIATTKARIVKLTEEISLLQTENEELSAVFRRVKSGKEETEQKLLETNKEIQAFSEINNSLDRVKEERQRELIRKRQELSNALAKAQKIQEVLKEKARQVELSYKLEKEDIERESTENFQYQQMIKKNIEQLTKETAKKKQEIVKLKAELKTYSEKEKDRVTDLQKEKKKLLKFVSNI